MFVGRDHKEEVKAIDFFQTHPDITHLDISGMGLYYLSDKIGLLQNLECLDLSNNKYSKLPIEIGLCKNLKQLILTGNPICELEPFCSLLKDDPQGPLHFFQSICNPSPLQVYNFQPIPPNAFTVYSWNLLAPTAAKENLYPFTEKRYLERDYRSQLIQNQLSKINSDIILIQETDADQMQRYLLPLAAARGMRFSFVPKGRYETKRDELKPMVPGLATFVSASAFDVFGSMGVVCNKLESVKNMPNLEELMKCDDVVQFTAVKLKRKPYINLVIVNVHIFFGSESVRVSFAEAIAREAVAYGHTVFKNFDIVIGGDFNAELTAAPITKFQEHHLTDAYDIFDRQTAKTANGPQNPPHRLTLSTESWTGCVDHIMLSRGLICEDVLPTETRESILQKNIKIPNRVYPSDHFAIGAVIRHKNRT